MMMMVNVMVSSGRITDRSLRRRDVFYHSTQTVLLLVVIVIAAIMVFQTTLQTVAYYRYYDW